MVPDPVGDPERPGCSLRGPTSRHLELLVTLRQLQQQGQGEGIPAWRASEGSRRFDDQVLPLHEGEQRIGGNRWGNRQLHGVRSLQPAQPLPGVQLEKALRSAIPNALVETVPFHGREEDAIGPRSSLREHRDSEAGIPLVGTLPFTRDRLRQRQGDESQADQTARTAIPHVAVPGHLALTPDPGRTNRTEPVAARSTTEERPDPL
jgi:hypothetical protein